MGRALFTAIAVCGLKSAAAQELWDSDRAWSSPFIWTAGRVPTQNNAVSFPACFDDTALVNLLKPVIIARITFPTGKLVLVDGSAMLFSGSDQDVTETTASCSASTLTTTTTTTTKTTPPDLCNQIKCVLQCEDECGWSRPRGMCVSSTISVTSQGEIDNLLGDCPSPISTIGNEKKSKTNYLLVSALSVGVLITFGFGILVGKRRTVKRFEQKGYLHFQKNGAYEPHDASRVPFLNENENCNDDRLLVGNDDDQLLGY